MNRIYVILVFFCLVLAFVVLFGTNVYINAFIVSMGLILSLCALSYVMDGNMNKSELRFFNKLATFFN